LKKIAAALAVLAALALAACGGGGGGTTASSTAAQPAAGSGGASGGKQGAQGSSQGQGSGQGQGQGGAKHGVPGDTSAHFTAPTHHDSATGAAQFETKAGDNSIQEFGSEAGSSDFAAAATALHGYLDARAAAAWAAACSYLSPGIAASLAQLGGGGGGASCPEVVAGLSVPGAALSEAAEAEVAALRIEGDRAFLLFHGAHGADYFMPMAHEGGAWKVAAIAPSAIL
jgi:hypothetical protein